MRSIMMSIQPKWVKKMLSGEKTIEVRKTRPKIKTPFKCYIYATKSGDRIILKNDKVYEISKSLTGKVVGEFTCEHISRLIPVSTSIDGVRYYLGLSNIGIKKTCLSQKELCEYGKGKNLYGWHISDLKIYDKPKEIREFVKPYCNQCYACVLYTTGKCFNVLTRPPQSWCYVEQI